MLKRLVLAVLTVLCLASPSLAYFPRGGGPGSGGGNSPLVTPGATQPQYNGAASGTNHLAFTGINVNTISTSFHGSSSDPNYNSRTFCRWDNPSFLEMTGTFQLGLVCHHSPTNAELLSGLDDNVTSVKIRCDEGAYATTTGQSANANANGYVDWNVTINTSTWSDGLHKCDAVAIPSTGPDGVMQGWPITPDGTRPDEYQSADLIYIDNGQTRGTAGHILTVLGNATVLNWKNSAADARIGYGQSVASYLVMPGTFIDGDANNNATSCAAETGSNCTGAGGAGTYHVPVSQTVYSAVATGTISNNAGGAGNIFNATAVSLGGYGDSWLYGSGFTSTQIVGSFNDAGGNLCIPYTGAVCSGAGLTGKYYISGSAQNVASTTFYSPGQATFGDMRSYYFLVNNTRTPTSTFGRGRVYACNGTCNKPGGGTVTGSDSNTGADGSHPVLTTGAGMNKLLAFDSLAPNMSGKWGGTLCLMNSGTSWVYSNVSGIPYSWLGYNEYNAANDPVHCPDTAATETSAATITNDINTRNYLSQPGKSLWRGLTFIGNVDTQSTGDATFLVADHVTNTKALYDTGGIFGAAWWCMESTSFFAPPCNSADVVRGTTIKYVQTDPFHNVHALWNNLVDGGGGSTMMWVQGTYNPATPATLSGITLPTDVTAAGNTLSSIFVGDAAGRDPYYHIPAAWDPANSACINGWDGTIVSATSNSVTFGGTPTDNGTCTNGQRVYVWGNNGNHPDFVQWTQVGTGVLSSYQDVFVLDNKFNPNYSSAGQGPFFETTGVDGIFVARNEFHKSGNAGDPSTADTVVGQNSNVTYSKNIFSGGGGQVHNRYVGSNAETFFKNVCVAGNKLLPVVTAGTNQQSVAAASTPCE